MDLQRLNTESYAKFIETHFKASDRAMDFNLVKEHIEYYDNHTFYVQYFFNRLFELGLDNYTTEAFLDCRETILKEKETIFYSYRKLLTKAQFTLLACIAKEKKTQQTQFKRFFTSI